MTFLYSCQLPWWKFSLYHPFPVTHAPSLNVEMDREAQNPVQASSTHPCKHPSCPELAPKDKIEEFHVLLSIIFAFLLVISSLMHLK